MEKLDKIGLQFSLFCANGCLLNKFANGYYDILKVFYQIDDK